jgi:hypothetical protein
MLLCASSGLDGGYGFHLVAYKQFSWRGKELYAFIESTRSHTIKERHISETILYYQYAHFKVIKMSDVKFNISPVDEMPKRMYRKGSKYDPILDAFLEGNHKLVTVEVLGKDGNYIRTQLKKRADARGLNIDISVVNNKVYLEK